eukprot:scaffold99897_cov18-Tisochrysis_lutea.AAC.2
MTLASPHAIPKRGRKGCKTNKGEACQQHGIDGNTKHTISCMSAVCTHGTQANELAEHLPRSSTGASAAAMKLICQASSDSSNIMQRSHRQTCRRACQVPRLNLLTQPPGNCHSRVSISKVCTAVHGLLWGQDKQ